MALTMEERKAKLAARMAAIQEQMEKIERGEPIYSGRGRAPNPMGRPEEMKALTRMISSLKSVEGLTYAAIASLLKQEFVDKNRKDLESLSEKGKVVLEDYPAAERKPKQVAEEGQEAEAA